MSKKNEQRVILGGVPRADLLPPEVKSAKVGAAIRRRISAALFIVIVLCATAYGLASVAAGNSLARLNAESERTVTLLHRQQQFAEVRTVEQQLVDIAAAQQIAAATEINWNGYFTDLVGTLPEGMEIKSFGMVSSSPTEALAPATVPLQGPRTASLILVTETRDLATVETWLDSLGALSGFADVMPGTANLDEATGIYKMTTTLHITTDAYTNRFSSPGASDESATTTGKEDE